MNQTITTKDQTLYQEGFLKKEMENQREQSLRQIATCQETIQRQKGDIVKRLSRLDTDENYSDAERKIERQSILYHTTLYLIQQEQCIFHQKAIIEHIDASLQTLSA